MRFLITLVISGSPHVLTEFNQIIFSYFSSVQKSILSVFSSWYSQVAHQSCTSLLIKRQNFNHFNQKRWQVQSCRSFCCMYCAFVSSADKIGQKVKNIHFYLEVFLPFITVSLMLVSATTSDFLRYNNKHLLAITATSQ